MKEKEKEEEMEEKQTSMLGRQIFQVQQPNN